MKELFYIPTPIKYKSEKIVKPFGKPLRYFTYSLFLSLLFIFISVIWIDIVNKPVYLFFDMVVFLFMLFFLIDFLKNSLKNEVFIQNSKQLDLSIPYFFRLLIYIKDRLFYGLDFIFKKIFLFAILLFSLLILTHLMLNFNGEILTLTHIYETIHLVMIWIFILFLFTFILNRYLIDIPYRLFLNMRAYTIQEVDLFTNTKSEIEHHKKDKIYIDIISLTETSDNEFLKIKTLYLRLIKFWYAQKNYLFKLRYYFPILISFSSLIYFFYLQYFIGKIQGIEPLQQMGLVAISLSILYFTMAYHINSLLYSKFYMNNILNELNRIYFDKHSFKQQIKIFLDKNFLVYIHDKNHDRHFCVNESEDFQNFISNEMADEEGRNLIVMVFISFFMILFIEVSTGYLLGGNESQENNSSIQEK